MPVAFTTNLRGAVLFLPIFLLKARYDDMRDGKSLAVLTLKSRSQPV
jgi:hypothetical protein